MVRRRNDSPASEEPELEFICGALGEIGVSGEARWPPEVLRAGGGNGNSGSCVAI